MGASSTPRFHVFTKADLLSDAHPAAFERLSGGYPWRALATSDTLAVNELETVLLDAVRAEEKTTEFILPYDAAKETLRMVYANCRVLHSEATDAGLRLSVQGPAPLIARIVQRTKGVAHA